MNRNITCFTTILATSVFLGISYAQQPPPANGGPPPQPPTVNDGAPPPPNPNAPPPPRARGGQPNFSRRGTIKSFNMGPNGETNGVILQDGTVATFPPEFGTQLRSAVREGSRITVTGVSRTGVSGQTVVDAQTITYKDQVMTVPAAPPPVGPGARAGAPPTPPDPNAPPPRGPRGRRQPAPPPPPPAPANPGAPAPANAGPPPAGATPPPLSLR